MAKWQAIIEGEHDPPQPFRGQDLSLPACRALKSLEIKSLSELVQYVNCGGDLRRAHGVGHAIAAEVYEYIIRHCHIAIQEKYA